MSYNLTDVINSTLNYGSIYYLLQAPSFTSQHSLIQKHLINLKMQNIYDLSKKRFNPKKKYSELELIKSHHKISNNLDVEFAIKELLPVKLKEKNIRKILEYLSTIHDTLYYKLVIRDFYYEYLKENKYLDYSVKYHQCFARYYPDKMVYFMDISKKLNLKEENNLEKFNKNIENKEIIKEENKEKNKEINKELNKEINKELEEINKEENNFKNENKYSLQKLLSKPDQEILYYLGYDPSVENIPVEKIISILSDISNNLFTSQNFLNESFIKTYFSTISEKNKNFLNFLISQSNLKIGNEINEETNQLINSYYHHIIDYNWFDVLHVKTDTHIYFYTRPEFKLLNDEKKIFNNRQKINPFLLGCREHFSEINNKIMLENFIEVLKED